MDKILMTKIVVMYGMFMILANFGKLDSKDKQGHELDSSEQGNKREQKDME